MRWVALGVDYEMSGKDLIPSAELGRRSAASSAAAPPEGFNYELFLDDQGKKISKSKGNGLSVEDWLRYAPPESLSLYMYQQPRRRSGSISTSSRARSTSILQFLDAYPRPGAEQQLGNPVWHIHSGPPPLATAGVLQRCCSTWYRVECRAGRGAVGLHQPLCAGRDAGGIPILAGWSNTPSTISATS